MYLTVSFKFLNFCHALSTVAAPAHSASGKIASQRIFTICMTRNELPTIQKFERYRLKVKKHTMITDLSHSYWFCTFRIYVSDISEMMYLTNVASTTDLLPCVSFDNVTIFGVLFCNFRQVHHKFVLNSYTLVDAVMYLSASFTSKTLH